MPSLEQALKHPEKIGELIEHQQRHPHHHTQITVPDPENPAGPNPFIRCPMPLVMNAPPADSLRQFYRDGVPQVRIITPSLKSIWQV